MKKVLTFVLLLFVTLGSLSAALIPTRDPYFDKDSVFSSPARLVETEWSTPFGVSMNVYSSYDFLYYLANPSAALAEASDYLYETLMNGDADFWSSNFSLLATLFDFDDSNNLPQSSFDIVAIRQYLRDSYSRRFSDAQKASAVLAAISNTSFFESADAPVLNGDEVLQLEFYAGNVYGNGFGWQIRADLGFNGGTNLLDSYSDVFRGSLLAFDIRADVGYAYSLSEHLSLGVSLGAGAMLHNTIVNSNLLSARFDANIVNAFSNDFNLGLGFWLNFGTLYRLNDSLAFALDLVNVASFRKYTDIELTDFVDYDGFDSDPNVYYVPLDLIIRAYWDEGPYHLVVEFGDVVNQLIISNALDMDFFDFYSVPKVYFTYDINKDFSLTTGLEYLKLLLGLEYKGFALEFSTALNKLAFGLSASYEF